MTQKRHCISVLFDQADPPGSYGQIRLMVTATAAPNNSYSISPTARGSGLRCRGGSETGLSWFRLHRPAAKRRRRLHDSTSTCRGAQEDFTLPGRGRLPVHP